MFVKNDIEGLPYAEKVVLQSPMDSREGSVVPLRPKDSHFVNSVRDVRSDFFHSVKCSSLSQSWWLTPFLF